MKKRVLLFLLVVSSFCVLIIKHDVYAAEDIEYEYVEIGGDEAFAISTDGEFYVWGSSVNIKLIDGTIVDGEYPTEVTEAFVIGEFETIIQVSIGSGSNGVLTSLGRVITYGSNSYGQLGDGTNDEQQIPVDITPNFALNPTEKIIKIKMDSGHSLAITNEGRLFTWGRATQGELGDVTFENRSLPVNVDSHFNLNPGEKILNGAFGSQHIIVYTSDNRVFSAGINSDGSLGTGVFGPVGYEPNDITSNFSFAPLDTIIDVSAAYTHSAILTAGGDLFTWGRNTYGVIGDGTSYNRATPVNITSGFGLAPTEKIISTDVSSFFASALTSEGRVFTWGNDYYGALGTGVDIYGSNSPLDITSNFSLDPGDKIISMDTGYRNIITSTTDNKYFIWGYGPYMITNITESEVYTPKEFFGPDYIAPVITASDESMLTEDNSSFVPNGTALDNQDGDITSNLVITYFLEDGVTSVSNLTSARDILYNGDKIVVKYNVEDAYENQATEVVTTITPVDNTLPVLYLQGDSVINLDIDQAYHEMDAQFADNVDGYGYATVGGEVVDVTTAGTYIVEYTYIDTGGNSALPVTRTVNVVDNEDPVISLNSNETIYFEYNDLYIEYGATYNDNADGTGDALVIANNVDTSILGTYTVTYSFTDTSGNTGTKNRTVIVGDWASPVLTLTGDATVYVEYGTIYEDLGATYTDNYDSPGDATLYGSVVDTSTIGTYYLGYEYTDSNNNIGFDVYRTIIVRDTTKPVITLAGLSNITIEAGSTYYDAGALYEDNYEGVGVATVISNNLDTSLIGSYEISYSYTDEFGNVALAVTRTITVEDTTIPVIELFGPSTVEVNYNKTFTDAGARVVDNNDKFGIVVVSGDTVDTSKLGSYTIKYNYTDTSGNVALEVLKTVNVVDNEKPVVTLNGDSLIYVELGTEYNELGAIFSDNYDGSEGDIIIGGDDVLSDVYGTYVVTYTSTDSNGNTSQVVSRSVFVRDTQAPIIEGVNNDDVLESGSRLAVTYNEGTATLNGVSYLSGQTINSPGDYELVVVDEYGNTSTVCFCIEEDNIIIVIIIIIAVIIVLLVVGLVVFFKLRNRRLDKTDETKQKENTDEVVEE
ncbi:immunoglobulin-like domain-containing protein [Candidatus Izimaplasma bacterium ZiA1]|uniref:immunoglobulin-like domain-containing protein n=1 Tax=Candidatus Izimoplasma sp. ZiA1 TaxID=2024899 RepID=UPI00143BABB1